MEERMGRTLLAALICGLLVSGPLRAEDTNTGDAANKPGAATSTEKAANAKAAKTENNKSEAAKPATDYREEIEELRQLMREQAQQLTEQQKQLELLRAELSNAKKSEVNAAAPAPTPAAEPTGLHVVTGDMATGIRPEAGNSTASAQDKPKSEDGPSSIKYKGVSITPGGFIEAATVTRSK